MNRIAAVAATVSLLPLSAAAQGMSAAVAAVIEELVAANRVLAAQGTVRSSTTRKRGVGWPSRWQTGPRS